MYQVGDSVMIRPDISVGKITKIKKCPFNEEGWFYLEADYDEYWWSTKMVIPLKQRTE